MKDGAKLALLVGGIYIYRRRQKSEEEKKLLTPSSSANQGIGNGGVRGGIYYPVPGLLAGDSPYITSKTQFIERQPYGQPWKWVKVPIQIYTAGPKRAGQDGVDYALTLERLPLRPTRGLAVDSGLYNQISKRAFQWISQSVPADIKRDWKRMIKDELNARMIKGPKG